MGRKIRGKVKTQPKTVNISKDRFWVVDTERLERYRNPEDSIRRFSMENTEDLAKASKTHLVRNTDSSDDRFIIIKGKDFNSAFKKIEKKIKEQKNQEIKKQIDSSEHIIREQQNQYYTDVLTILNTKTGEPEHKRIVFLKNLKETIQGNVYGKMLNLKDEKDINKENRKRIDSLSDEFERTIFIPDFRDDRKFVKELFSNK